MKLQCPFGNRNFSTVIKFVCDINQSVPTVRLYSLLQLGVISRGYFFWSALCLLFSTVFLWRNRWIKLDTMVLGIFRTWLILVIDVPSSNSCRMTFLTSGLNSDPFRPIAAWMHLNVNKSAYYLSFYVTFHLWHQEHGIWPYFVLF